MYVSFHGLKVLANKTPRAAAPCFQINSTEDDETRHEVLEEAKVKRAVPSRLVLDFLVMSDKEFNQRYFLCTASYQKERALYDAQKRAAIEQNLVFVTPTELETAKLQREMLLEEESFRLLIENADLQKSVFDFTTAKTSEETTSIARLTPLIDDENVAWIDTNGIPPSNNAWAMRNAMLYERMGLLMLNREQPNAWIFSLDKKGDVTVFRLKTATIEECKIQFLNMVTKYQQLRADIRGAKSWSAYAPNKSFFKL